MSNNKDGGKPSFAQDGYTVRPGGTGTVHNGYKPTTGALGTPPSSGTVVSKPPASKK